MRKLNGVGIPSTEMHSQLFLARNDDSFADHRPTSVIEKER